MNIFLIGPMGAGKTTIGRYLAKTLGLTFHDTDQVLEKRTGADLRLIFDIEGEDGFHKRERQIVEELTKLNNIVLATGGGVVAVPENRVSLRSRGTVIYLKVSLEQQYERTKNDKKRPQLQTTNLKQTLEKLDKERAMMYDEIADCVVETEGKSIRAIVKQIIDFIQREQQ